MPWWAWLLIKLILYPLGFVLFTGLLIGFGHLTCVVFCP